MTARFECKQIRFAAVAPQSFQRPMHWLPASARERQFGPIDGHVTGTDAGAFGIDVDDAIRVRIVAVEFLFAADAAHCGFADC